MDKMDAARVREAQRQAAESLKAIHDSMPPDAHTRWLATMDEIRHGADSFESVTRIEVIGNERHVVTLNAHAVRVFVQDDGRTLKVIYEESAQITDEMSAMNASDDGPLTAVDSAEAMHESENLSTRERFMNATQSMDGRAAQALEEMREADRSQDDQSTNVVDPAAQSAAYDRLNIELRKIKEAMDPEDQRQFIQEIEELRDSEGYIE